MCVFYNPYNLWLLGNFKNRYHHLVSEVRRLNYTCILYQSTFWSNLTPANLLLYGTQYIHDSVGWIYLQSYFHAKPPERLLVFCSWSIIISLESIYSVSTICSRDSSRQGYIITLTVVLSKLYLYIHTSSFHSAMLIFTVKVYNYFISKLIPSYLNPHDDMTYKKKSASTPNYSPAPAPTIGGSELNEPST